ncbi:hypothetical protein Ae406Ps2_6195c [Pseudonocardia sp. Ae406_Ps2]|nr:hypothetical protein Ae150APs1_6033 [Pseudonocardia sp. Ae150A_Ps1]OLL70635.1 hypothetical protein Ae168Ps1_6100 [Pseudonocardia sp. Ae168_Ps1]OLL70775.1 hypothetical protein Ae263Ps1_6189 [Pseudonocardia sp. Ae263_Ps1]OLL89337.1 hypothetical protein Ae356Ps1_6081 [Pseudonocardia sp. Ae356_Ps1]OLL90040.1 hypothetical protein Ae406Ps2_6195c [Pseudonocardia sp. Ae406_Ps2]
MRRTRPDDTGTEPGTKRNPQVKASRPYGSRRASGPDGIHDRFCVAFPLVPTLTDT